MEEILSKLLKDFLGSISLPITLGAFTVGTLVLVKVYYNKNDTSTRSKNALKVEGDMTAGGDITNGNPVSAGGDVRNVTEINNYYTNQAPKSNLAEDAAGIEYKKEPLPSQMLDKVQELPRGEQPAARKDYVGQSFEWNLEFHKLTKKGDDSKYRVFFNDPQDFGKPMVYCDLSLKDHPRLQYLKEGDRLKVAGALKCFSGKEIDLDLDKITYDGDGESFSKKMSTISPG